MYQYCVCVCVSLDKWAVHNVFLWPVYLGEFKYQTIAAAAPRKSSHRIYPTTPSVIHLVTKGTINTAAQVRVGIQRKHRSLDHLGH